MNSPLGGSLAGFITILHGGGGVCRDPQIVLRNIWTAPNHNSSREAIFSLFLLNPMLHVSLFTGFPEESCTNFSDSILASSMYDLTFSGDGGRCCPSLHSKGYHWSKQDSPSQLLENNQKSGIFWTKTCFSLNCCSIPWHGLKLEHRLGSLFNSLKLNTWE